MVVRVVAQSAILSAYSLVQSTVFKEGFEIGFAGFPSTVCFSLVWSEIVVAS